MVENRESTLTVEEEPVDQAAVPEEVTSSSTQMMTTADDDRQEEEEEAAAPEATSSSSAQRMIADDDEDDDDDDDDTLITEEEEKGPADRAARAAWRVKVYRLNDAGQWDDRGTGEVAIDTRGECGPTMRVGSEDDGVTLLGSKVAADVDAYQRQGDNIITWDAGQDDAGIALNDNASCSSSANATASAEETDECVADTMDASSTNTDCVVALSFQEKEGCDEVWRRLSELTSALVAAAGGRRPGSPPPPPRLLNGEDGDIEPNIQTRPVSNIGSHGFLTHILGSRGLPLAASLSQQDDLDDDDDDEEGPRHHRTWELEEEEQLPAPNSESLPVWCRSLARAVTNMTTKERHVAALLDDGASLLRQLAAVFADAEDLDDVPTLRTLADVAKLLVLLNERPLLEALLEDPLYEPTLGALEYAADLKPRERRHQREEDETTAAEAQRVPYRELTLGAKFREAVPIEDELLKSRILQNFRAQVLRDAVQRPGLDDSQLSAIHSLTFFNNNEILRRLHVNSDYLRRVVDLARDDEEADERRLLALRFLREMVSMSRNVLPEIREPLYRHLFRETPLYEALSDSLRRSFEPERDQRLVSLERSCCVEIIATALRVNASSLRHYLLQLDNHPKPPHWAPEKKKQEESEEGGETLLLWLVRLVHCESDLAVQMHAADSIKLSLDTETMEDKERESFLGLFYDHYIIWLVAPLYEEEEQDNKAIELRAARCSVCEVLAHCVRYHAYRMKFFVMRNNVVRLIIRLIDRPESSGKQLTLCALRFVRACIGAKDDFYNRYLVKNATLAPIFKLLTRNSAISCVGDLSCSNDADVVDRCGRRRLSDSLLTSAVAELVEFVRQENVKSLVSHIVQTYAEAFESSEVNNDNEMLKSLFASLRTRYEQNEDLLERAQRPRGLASTLDSALTQAQIERRERILAEDNDEAYFDDDDDDDDDDDEEEEQGWVLESTSTTTPPRDDEDEEEEEEEQQPPPEEEEEEATSFMLPSRPPVEEEASSLLLPLRSEMDEEPVFGVSKAPFAAGPRFAARQKPKPSLAIKWNTSTPAPTAAAESPSKKQRVDEDQ